MRHTRRRTPARDVETPRSTDAFAATLRRLAAALDAGRPFSIRIAGERVRVPASARVTIEHERTRDVEEVEFQLTWTPRPALR
jgi:amphi-Trp domain-containing protein